METLSKSIKERFPQLLTAFSLQLWLKSLTYYQATEGSVKLIISSLQKNVCCSLKQRAFINSYEKDISKGTTAAIVK